MSSDSTNGDSTGSGLSGRRMLFWACFVSLIATAFGFQARMFLLGTWEGQFGLSETQKGEILGAGLWPFAISIILFSLVIDRIGYGKAMVFACGCHLVQALMLWQADGYAMLYWGSIIGALGNGTIEAVINPVVATMFPKQKVKWLAILHAGWPGGLVIAGLLFMAVGQKDAAGAFTNWQILVALSALPVIIYAVMLIGRKFPVQERVQAGVTFREMLQEPGILSWAVAVILVVLELGRVLINADWANAHPEMATGIKIAAIAILVVPYALYVRALGRPMYFLLLLVMMLLATTELGIDGWSRELMEGSFKDLAMDAGWVLILTSFIMMVLRFFAGPITHKLPPLNLLAISALVAGIGVYSLGMANGYTYILTAAVIYGFGKTFFWPATLGFVSERFPRGGAMTINMIAGVGMLSVGTVGTAWLGFVQDRAIETELADTKIDIFEPEKKQFLGIIDYRPISQEKKKALGAVNSETVGNAENNAKKSALKTAAFLPISMLVAYIGLIFYFKSHGGYRAIDLDSGPAAEPDTIPATANAPPAEDTGDPEPESEGGNPPGQ